MNLHNLKQKRVRHILHGIFSKGIEYVVRNIKGDWSPYFGVYESQRHDDLDSNCCWSFAGNEVAEDQLEFLWKTNQFSEEDKKWFFENGYIDADGDFYLSRRFIPTLSGVKRNGNDQAEAWRLTQKYGAIPNSRLPYQNNETYFDPFFITQELKDLGQQFLKRVNIAYKEVGTRFKGYDIKQLSAELKQSELQIGIPVPVLTYLWNATKVDWDGGKQAAHSVALYKIDEITDPEYPYYIFDQYEPHLKQLSADYYIPICTKAVVTPVTPFQLTPPVSVQYTVWKKVWLAVQDFFNRS